MNTNEKFKDWIKKAVEGEKGYEVILNQDGRMKYCSEKYIDVVEKITILIWEDNKIIYKYSQHIMNENIQDMISIVIKKQKKVLFFDGQERLFSFGFSNGERADSIIMISYQFKTSATLILASNIVSDVKVLNYLRDEIKDAVDDFTSMLFRQVDVKEEGK